jgi:hypothetical protein
LLINQEINEVATLSNGGSSHGSNVLIRKTGLRLMRQTNVTLIGVAKKRWTKTTCRFAPN